MGAVRYDQLSRREREMMDVIYARGEATAAEVRRSLADAPSYSAVRATLRILEEKGCLRHRREGRRYVYLPTTPRTRIRRRELRKLVETFFDGRPDQAFAALLDLSAKDLSEEELARLRALLDEAGEEGG